MKNINLLILILIVCSCTSVSTIKTSSQMAYRRISKKLSKKKITALQALEAAFNAAEAELAAQEAIYCEQVAEKGRPTIRTLGLLKKAKKNMLCAQEALPAESFLKWDQTSKEQKERDFERKADNAQARYDRTPTGRAILVAVQTMLDAAEALDLGEKSKK